MDIKFVKDKLRSSEYDFLRTDRHLGSNIILLTYPLRDLKNIFSDMNNIVRDYSKLNHRNSKKDELHLNKHAMHLIRLHVTGTEILEGKGIATFREKEHQLLLDKRNSKYSYREIFDMVDEYEIKFKKAAQKTALPEAPDFKRIEALMIEIYERSFNT